jgi:1,4-alpha-glucan branching enzyme
MRLGEVDLHLFNEGRHARLYEKLGAQPEPGGTHFAVWAPNAAEVRVTGDFAGWGEGVALSPVGSSGIWAGSLAGVGPGATYKYRVAAKNGYRVEKADPYAAETEVPPRTASIVWQQSHVWTDHEWMKTRGRKNALDAPISIYEVHLGSWMRGDHHRHLTYRELAPRLAAHVARLGYTHVELMPVMEHPFYGSWGYLVTGFFAPSARYGTPDDFMFLVDHLHEKGIGVILDWVPAHFPSDEHGLIYFDGTHLYEHADPRLGHHPDWKSAIFNFGRHEVQSFLLSSANCWLERFHADGLRIDAVASMLYRDYSRKDGEWIPNEYGGRENLEAIAFLRELNSALYREHPDIVTIAEESTAWPMVSRPTYVGGLGFGLKWDMGWMHDTLSYLSHDPVHRAYHHGQLTFRGLYAFHENFVLPLSHDEVVHGKGSLLNKMPGDDWQKRANLRLLYAYQTAQPGKKLLFMGGELGTYREWDHESGLEWHLLEDPRHGGLALLLGELNRLYRDHPALHAWDAEPRGFRWIDANDAPKSVATWERRGPESSVVVVAFNFTPVPRENYRIGVDRDGDWIELLNTDAPAFGGSGMGNLGRVTATPIPWHGRPFSLNLTLPPLGALYLGPA